MNIKTIGSKLVLFAGFLLGLGLCGAAASGSARLVSLKTEVHSQELEVRLGIEGAFRHGFFELQGPARLVVDLTPAELTGVPPEVDVGAFGVARIRTGQPAPGTARVVFEFSERKPFYLISTLPDGLLVTFFEASAGGRKTVPPESRAATPAAEEGRRHAPEEKQKPGLPPRRRTTFVGASLTNVTLADERFTSIFGGRTATCLAVDLSQVFLKRGPLSLALAVEYKSMALEGLSTITLQKSETTLRPLDVGLRVLFQQGSLWPYAAAGPVFFSYEERSPLHFTSGSTTGFSLQGGLYWGPPSFPALKARAFFKWTKAVAEENGLEIDLGGLEFGAGLSLAFSFF